MTAPRVLAVVVTHDGAEVVGRCLASLRAEATCATVVIDNRSADATVSIVRASFPDAALVTLDENLGFGRGNNVGIERALADGFEYTLLLNQDAYLLPGSLERLLHVLDAHPDYGVATPLHCGPTDARLDEKTYVGYLRQHAYAYFSDAALGRAQPHYPVHGVNAAAWLLRTEVFRVAGGFDPLFFMYGEDDDLLARFAFHGIAFALVPEARIVHLRHHPASATPVGRWPTLRAGARRAAAALTARAKAPGNGLVQILLQALVHGVAIPCATFLVDRRWRPLACEVAAACTVLSRAFAIRRSATLCATRGPHFLRTGQGPAP